MVCIPPPSDRWPRVLGGTDKKLVKLSMGSFLLDICTPARAREAGGVYILAARPSTSRSKGEGVGRGGRGGGGGCS